MKLESLSTIIPVCISAILIIIVISIFILESTTSRMTSINNAKSSSNITTTDCRRSVAVHILLIFITFGIYNFVWIYRMTKYFNQTHGEARRDPVKKLFLCLLIPLYYQYWIYQTALRADKLAKDKGVFSNLTTICSVSAFIIPFIPGILIQDRVNTIIDYGKSQSSPKETILTMA